MNSFPFITGSVSSIRNLAQEGRSHMCSFLIELDTHDGPVSLLLTSNTYVYDCHSLEQGDLITAFYDPNAPVPLIYPPRYTALAIVETKIGTTAVFDVFDEESVKPRRYAPIDSPAGYGHRHSKWAKTRPDSRRKPSAGTVYCFYKEHSCPGCPRRGCRILYRVNLWFLAGVFSFCPDFLGRKTPAFYFFYLADY